MGKCSIADSEQPVRGLLHDRFSYAVDGSRFVGKFHSSHEWEKEAEVSLLYNPQNPLESCVCDEDGSHIPPVLACALELFGELISIPFVEEPQIFKSQNIRSGRLGRYRRQLGSW